MPEESKPRRKSPQEDSAPVQQPLKPEPSVPKTPATAPEAATPPFDPALWDFMVA